MRKLLLALLASTMISGVYAQENRLGVEAGLNVTSVSGDDTLAGFNAGLIGEYNFNSAREGWLLGYGLKLNFLRFGLSNDIIDPTTYPAQDAAVIGESSVRYNPFYLNIPVTAGYRFALSNDFSLSLNAGLYGNIGLWGKAKFKSKLNSGATTSSSSNVFGDESFRRFNWGWLTKATVEYKGRYRLSVGYNRGFSDPARDYGKESTFSVTLGYMF